jgi:hypothetical protein
MNRKLLLLAMPLVVLNAQDYNRTAGNYPGAPAEYAGPTLVDGGSTYRNLALRRPAYHSSAWDYNLTAQLVTDGIKETAPPRWVNVTTSGQAVLPMTQREVIFDESNYTALDVTGKRAWIQIELAGGAAAPAIDRVDVDATEKFSDGQPQNWTTVLSGSPDGKEWKELAREDGLARTTGEVRPSLRLATATRSRFLRLEFLCGRPLSWHVMEVSLFNKNQVVRAGGPFNFSSSWRSAKGGEQWVYVDLGAKSEFDRVALLWFRRPSSVAIQVSDDVANWSAVQDLPSAGLKEDVKLAKPASGRYVRVLMNGVDSEPYILSELEVFGRGGLVPKAKPAAKAAADGSLQLAGGEWRVQRESLVKAAPAAISAVGFAAADWVIGTVPATVLVSYLNAGAIPDPNYADNQLMVSDSFFQSDFWYRNEFTAAPAAGKRQWLNFNGVNWKADVYLNGQKVGRIEGAFTRAKFDVTALLKPGKNAVAVKIEKNKTPSIFKEKTFQSPGINGGSLGADNPTFHASIGWDWIPPIHGRDTGIWNDVFLTSSGAVTVEDPHVATTLPLPDTTKADVVVEATLRNATAAPVSGVLRGRFGDVAFEQPVTLEASATKAVKFDPAKFAQLHLQNPKLWWPNGYGDQNLYPVELSFVAADKQVSDAKKFQAGVRQFTYSEEGNALKIWVNGRRFVPRGGNWGFSESMLRYRAREYDASVRYHKEMNFTMIRNWVGQVGEDAFYEACDKYGIVVWQDFWLANPWDGPNPDNDKMFEQNAKDLVLRIRNHPSVGLYCGRNEGYPPLDLENYFRKIIGELHPGNYYIPSSADDSVGGHGPYQAQPVKYYFTERATPKLHSELGMPNVVTMDSLKLMMPESAMWPQGQIWGLHDFSLNGAQGGASFRRIIDQSYGGAKNAEEWVSLAQFVNYEGHRAMYEAQGKNRQGLLIWMSHPAWPTMVWQTYDYYLNAGSGYFGSKKGSEPLHIQWNPATNNVEVVNYNGGSNNGLSATAEILNLDASVKWTKTAAVDSAEDSVVTPFAMEYPAGLSPTHFIRLKLTRNGQTVSENFYWRGTAEADYRALRELPKVKLEAATRVEERGGRWFLTTDLSNPSSTPALMVAVKAVREKSGDRITPAIYNDNYVALMPGEKRTITTELYAADARGERPAIMVEGFNVATN